MNFFNISWAWISNSKCNLIFFKFELVTQKWKNKILTIKLVTRSETFYFFNFELVTRNRNFHFSTSS